MVTNFIIQKVYTNSLKALFNNPLAIKMAFILVWGGISNRLFINCMQLKMNNRYVLASQNGKYIVMIIFLHAYSESLIEVKLMLHPFSRRN